MKKITVTADVALLGEVNAAIDSELEAVGCPMKTQMQIDIAVEEIFVNIAHYAYTPENGEVSVSFELTEDRLARITFEDSGIPFDPMAQPDPDVSSSLSERQIGGLGIFMVKNSMDNMHYEYRDGKNILTIEKKL